MTTLKHYSPIFCCMSDEELREHELDCKMQAELSEMWQMDKEDLFDVYGVDSHIDAEEAIIESYRDIA